MILGFILLLIHAFLSLIVASAIFPLWLGGAALAIILPLSLWLRSGRHWVRGDRLCGGGGAAVDRHLGDRGRGGDVFLDIAIPDAGGFLTLTDLAAAVLATLVVTYLAWKASSWASSIARAAPGGYCGWRQEWALRWRATAGLGAAARSGAGLPPGAVLPGGLPWAALTWACPGAARRRAE